MTEGKCAIWGTPATVSLEGVYRVYQSNRAGGSYKIHQAFANQLPIEVPENRIKFTNWLVGKRISGDVSPVLEVGDAFFFKILSAPFLSTTERLKRFFVFCSKYKNRIGSRVFISNYNSANGASADASSDQIMYAFIEKRDVDEDYSFIKLLLDSGYIDRQYVLTYKAFERIDELSNSNANSNQAFVAMWFDGKMDDIYANGIQPAIEGENFKPVRIDKEHHTKNIIDFMIGEIKRSKFVVADFTSMILKDGDDRDRQVDIGGVYFEAGYALGLNIPVIWTCHKDHSGSIHFDLKQFNTIFYTDPDDLKLQLSTRIRAMFVS